MYIIGGKVTMIDLDDFIELSSIEIGKLQKMIMQTFFFIGIANVMACYIISFAVPCDTRDECNNWFFSLMKNHGFRFEDSSDQCASNSNTKSPKTFKLLVNYGVVSSIYLKMVSAIVLSKLAWKPFR